MPDSGAFQLAIPIIAALALIIIGPTLRPRRDQGYNRAEIPASAWGEMPEASEPMPRPFDWRHRMPASDFDTPDERWRWRCRS